MNALVMLLYIVVSTTKFVKVTKIHHDPLCIPSQNSFDRRLRSQFSSLWEIIDIFTTETFAKIPDFFKSH